MEQQNLDGSFCDGFFGFAKIYTLNGLNTKPFYVGCTVLDIEERLGYHMSGARQSARLDIVPSLKNRIIQENYFQITATIVDMMWVTGRNKQEANAQARFLEMKWIHDLKAKGFDLCNQQMVDMSTNRPQYVGKIVCAA